MVSANIFSVRSASAVANGSRAGSPIAANASSKIYFLYASFTSFLEIPSIPDITTNKSSTRWPTATIAAA